MSIKLDVNSPAYTHADLYKETMNKRGLTRILADLSIEISLEQKSREELTPDIQGEERCTVEGLGLGSYCGGGRRQQGCSLLWRAARLQGWRGAAGGCARCTGLLQHCTACRRRGTATGQRLRGEKGRGDAASAARAAVKKLRPRGVGGCGSLQHCQGSLRGTGSVERRREIYEFGV